MIRLPRLSTNWDTQPGLFERFWNTAMSSIEENINGISTALAAAVAAQSTADGAAISVVTAQTTANTALTNAATANTNAANANANANTRVLKSAGPAWTDATGTTARTAYASYTAATISNPPTQAEVQAVANALQDLSRHVTAIINDLKSNGALT